MTDKEKVYLRKRLEELYQKKLELTLQRRKVEKEIISIQKKLGERGWKLSLFQLLVVGGNKQNLEKLPVLAIFSTEFLCNLPYWQIPYSMVQYSRQGGEQRLKVAFTIPATLLLRETAVRS